ncbi:HTH-type transcriptional regulator DmlR [compost metagenome]
MDAVAAYVRRYPGVKVELQMLDRTVNLVDERIDLAIRTSNELDPNLIARRLSVCRSVVCAAPAYLSEHGVPQRVEDLSRHNCLTHAYFGHSLWHFEVAGQQVAVPVAGNISANEAMTLQKAALASAGIAMLPTYQAADALRRGELVRLLPEAQPRELNLNAVYTSRKHMPATLRSMLDFLVQRFKDEPEWDRDL